MPLAPFVGLTQPFFVFYVPVCLSLYQTLALALFCLSCICLPSVAVLLSTVCLFPFCLLTVGCLSNYLHCLGCCIFGGYVLPVYIYVVCLQYASCFYDVCLSVYCLFVCLLYFVCKHFLGRLYAGYLHAVSYLLPSKSLFSIYMYALCLLSYVRLLSVCSLSDCCMSAVCLLTIYSLLYVCIISAVCVQFFRGFSGVHLAEFSLSSVGHLSLRSVCFVYIS